MVIAQGLRENTPVGAACPRDGSCGITWEPRPREGVGVPAEPAPCGLGPAGRVSAIRLVPQTQAPAAPGALGSASQIPLGPSREIDGECTQGRKSGLGRLVLLWKPHTGAWGTGLGHDLNPAAHHSHCSHSHCLPRLLCGLQSKSFLPERPLERRLHQATASL